MQPDAIAFDAFGTLFDLEALRTPLGDDVFEGFAARLVPWTWHVTAAGTFSPLPEIAHAAARAAGASAEQADRLPDELAQLPAFPDVAAGLDTLAGWPLAVLSNGTGAGIRSLVEHAGLSTRFEHLLSADQAGCYKPSRELYALAPRAFRTRADRVLLVSSNEWDVTGAASSGLRTAWLGRGREPSWVLGVEPDLAVDSLSDLAQALG
ncbi:MAG: 2-haloacid dehalogenase [Thermoleophilaceae bacterium]|jgi:2-haloacid dehalogenase|nr:2-haloacid dehalogenase [Thermoleophilaceae bacterium]